MNVSNTCSRGRTAPFTGGVGYASGPTSWPAPDCLHDRSWAPVPAWRDLGLIIGSAIYFLSYLLTSTPKETERERELEEGDRGVAVQTLHAVRPRGNVPEK
jgi:hypothetical protein